MQQIGTVLDQQHRSLVALLHLRRQGLVQQLELNCVGRKLFRDALQVRIGQSVQLAVDGTPGNFTGRVTRLSPTITERTRVLQMEADIPNANGALRAGSFARATVVTDTTTASLTVPAEALVTFAGIEKVLTIKDGKALEVVVQTGRHTDELIEVKSGLEVGSEVVLDPGNLQTGDSVTPSRAEDKSRAEAG